MIKQQLFGADVLLECLSLLCGLHHAEVPKQKVILLAEQLL